MKITQAEIAQAKERLRRDQAAAARQQRTAEVNRLAWQELAREAQRRKASAPPRQQAPTRKPVTLADIQAGRASWDDVPRKADD